MSLSSEKRTEILQLLSAGKITAEEAAELLTATPAAPIENIEEPSPPPAPAPVKASAAPKT
jgi:hypothetical protein